MAEGAGGAGAAAHGGRLRALLALAWPIVVSRSSQVVVGIADAVMVAHLGAAALVPLVPAALGPLSFAPEVRALMEDYLAIRLLSAGAVVGIEALGNYYGGLGNTRLPMRASLAALLINVVRNWLLID